MVNGDSVNITAIHAETGESIPFIFTPRITTYYWFFPDDFTWDMHNGGWVLFNCPPIDTSDDVIHCLTKYTTWEIPPINDTGWVGGTSVEIKQGEYEWEVTLYRYTEPHVNSFTIESFP